MLKSKTRIFLLMTHKLSEDRIFVSYIQVGEDFINFSFSLSCENN